MITEYTFLDDIYYRQLVIMMSNFNFECWTITKTHEFYKENKRFSRRDEESLSSAVYIRSIEVI